MKDANGHNSTPHTPTPDNPRRCLLIAPRGTETPFSLLNAVRSINVQLNEVSDLPAAMVYLAQNDVSLAIVLNPNRLPHLNVFQDATRSAYPKLQLMTFTQNGTSQLVPLSTTTQTHSQPQKQSPPSQITQNNSQPDEPVITNNVVNNIAHEKTPSPPVNNQQMNNKDAQSRPRPRPRPKVFDVQLSKAELDMLLNDDGMSCTSEERN